ncbi:MAG: hypothetical protein AAGH17_04105, partial [Pseudomonadota bacterium]
DHQSRQDCSQKQRDNRHQKDIGPCGHLIHPGRPLFSREWAWAAEQARQGQGVFRAKWGSFLVLRTNVWKLDYCKKSRAAATAARANVDPAKTGYQNRSRDIF